MIKSNVEMPNIKIKSKDNKAKNNNTIEDSIFQPIPMKSVIYMLTTPHRIEANTDTETETDDKK